jgi:hypothetical protein
MRTPHEDNRQRCNPGHNGMLEVQIDLSGVLRIGREVVPGTWQFSALGHDGAADFRRKVINVIWIPRRIFNDLGNGPHSLGIAQID